MKIIEQNKLLAAIAFYKTCPDGQYDEDVVRWLTDYGRCLGLVSELLDHIPEVVSSAAMNTDGDFGHCIICGSPVKVWHPNKI